MNAFCQLVSSNASVLFSSALCIYSIIDMIHWINTKNSVMDKWANPAKFMICILSGMILFTIILFISQLNLCNINNCHLCYPKCLGVWSLIFGGLYVAATVMEIDSTVYCDYYLCELQIFQFMTLPFSITIILFLDLCTRCRIRICIFLFTFILIGILQSISILLPLINYLLKYGLSNIHSCTHAIYLLIANVFFIVCSIAICFTKNMDPDVKVLGKFVTAICFIGVVLCSVFMLILNINGNDYNMMQVNHNVLLIFITLFVSMDTVDYIVRNEYPPIPDEHEPSDEKKDPSLSVGNDVNDDTDLEPVIAR
eukprot:425545_1